MVFSGGLEEGFGAGAPGVGTAGIDGADGAQLMQAFKTLVEAPLSMLA